MSELPAETERALIQASATLRVWIAAVRSGDDDGDDGDISADEAATLQVVAGAMVERLAEVCDAGPTSGDGDDLPVHRGRCALVLIDRLLWAAQGGYASAPSRAYLIGAAEFALFFLSQVPLTPGRAGSPGRGSLSFDGGEGRSKES